MHHESGSKSRNRYDAWMEVNRFTLRAKKNLRERLRAAGDLPSFSVVMPVFDPPARHLRSAIASVHAQVLADWELCIADDGSTRPEVLSTCRDAAQHPRVHLTARTENGGISAATNTAAERATGDFLIFLDHDDELAPDALAEFALAVASHPQTDLAYSDTDKIDEHGRHYDPAFKPDWSPELLLTYMYCGQPLVIRRALFERLGGMRLGFEGSQDHDLALRASEVSRRVHHVPKVLYHWRAVAGSTAVSGNEKPYSIEAGRKAVQEALRRRESPGIAVQPDWAEKAGNALFYHEFPDAGPTVGLIIPSRDRLELLDRCLSSLNRTSYRDYCAFIADNGSEDRVSLVSLAASHGAEVLDCDRDGPFNFSAVCNRAAASIEADYLLFLNNDTEVIEPAWLSRMVGYLGLAGVGAVGGLLRYPDGRVQHAGVVHGLQNGLAEHAFKLLPPGDRGYQSWLDCARNCLAVTAACMLVPRQEFLSRGGFDEDHFTVAYNDADYCYRLVADGRRVVYSPGSILVHHEGASRGHVDDPGQVAEFRARYEDLRDRYYSPSLSLENERFEIEATRIVVEPPSSVRTAVVTHNLNMEGAPKFLQDSVLALHDRELIDPVIISPSEGPLRRQYEEHGLEVVVTDLPVLGPSRPAYDTSNAGFAALLLRHSAETVWANTLQGFFAIDAAKRVGLPSVWLIHESEDWRHGFAWIDPRLHEITERSFAHPYRVVFASDSTRAVYAELNTRNNFSVVQNGIPTGDIESFTSRVMREDCRRLLGISRNEVVFLSIGTVCERKRQLDLVEAVAEMGADELAGVRVLILGGLWSSYARELLSRVRSMPPAIRDRITIRDSLSATAPYYRAADALVLTSHLESYPRVVLEAMAFGLPVVATPVFGVTEQIRDGFNGLFFPPGDTASLREALLELKSAPERRAAMGEASRAQLRSLPSYERMLRCYGEFLQEAYFTSDGPSSTEFADRTDPDQLAVSAA